MGCFVITGGGTGGHLAVARSLKEAFIAQGDEVIFIGSTRGQDRLWFEDDTGWKETYFLPTQGVVNQNFLGKILSLWKIFIAMVQTLKIFHTHRVVAVVSVGGYSASPASFGALVRGIPLFIHEQNGVTGRLNAILRPYAKGFFSSFDPHSFCKDYPVREEFFAHARVRTSLKTIIFLGGSQGAKGINDFALALAPLLTQKGVAIIHQAGKNELERVTKAYESMGIKADIFPFDTDIVKRYEKADFAVSRAGASALFELMANGLPTLFVPYPYAAGDHQMANAMFVVDQHLGAVSRENALSLEAVLDYCDKDLSAMSKGLQDAIHPNGAKCMTQKIVEILKGV